MWTEKSLVKSGKVLISPVGVRERKHVHFSPFLGCSFVTCCFLHGHPKHFDLHPGSLPPRPPPSDGSPRLCSSLSPFSSSKSRVAQLIKSAAVGRYFHIQAAKKGNADEAPAAIHRVQVSADAAAAAANGWVPDNSPALCWWISALISFPPCSPLSQVICTYTAQLQWSCWWTSHQSSSVFQPWTNWSGRWWGKVRAEWIYPVKEGLQFCGWGVPSVNSCSEMKLKKLFCEVTGFCGAALWLCWKAMIRISVWHSVRLQVSSSVLGSGEVFLDPMIRTWSLFYSCVVSDPVTCLAASLSDLKPAMCCCSGRELVQCLIHNRVDWRITNRGLTSEWDFLKCWKASERCQVQTERRRFQVNSDSDSTQRNVNIEVG